MRRLKKTGFTLPKVGEYVYKTAYFLFSLASQDEKKAEKCFYPHNII